MEEGNRAEAEIRALKMAPQVRRRAAAEHYCMPKKEAPFIGLKRDGRRRDTV